MKATDIEKLAYSLDEQSVAIFFTIDSKQVVLLQACFETAENMAITRTVDQASSLLCLLTSKNLLPEVARVLESIDSFLDFQVKDPSELEERFLSEELILGLR